MAETIKKMRKTILSVVIMALPVIAFAQGTGVRGADFSWIDSVITEVGQVVRNAVPILLGVALLVFIWGVVRFMITDDENGRTDGKKKMMWGIVGLFVIVSVWGLVILLQTLMGIEGQDAISPPQIPKY